MTQFFANILTGINSLIGNYGWSMVIFTVLIKLLISPLDYKSRKGMRRTQLIQPEIAKLQKKYANDKDKMNQKMAELYRKENISPMSGCLPLLISMPLLFIMFAAMRNVANMELAKQAIDLLVNGVQTNESWLWIRNLWMPDSPFYAAIADQQNLQIIPADIWAKVYAGLTDATRTALEGLGVNASNISGQTLFPLLQATEAYTTETALWHELPKLNLLITQMSIYAKPNGWFILPIMACVTQLLMSATTQQPQQPAAEGQPDTGKFMKYFFPVFSLFICASSNASFALYWVVSNVFAWAEQLIFNKVFEIQDRKGNTGKSVKEEDSIK
ncbi:MAG: YidC/Oxa1 family membrane protein insertase [Clostridiales bacterium]|nr:YidC/Oxa1 family membrane protein insertase [Clostridiales bacterium]